MDLIDSSMQVQGSSGCARKRIRMPVWTLRDTTSLVEMYEKYHDVIVGGFCANSVPRSRQSAWIALYEEFNSIGPDNLREVVHIQTKISNVKDEARRYTKSLRLHETEDGPTPPQPPYYVKKMVDIVKRHTGSSSFSNGTCGEHEITTSSLDTCAADFEPKRIRLSDSLETCENNPHQTFSAFSLHDEMKDIKPVIMQECELPAEQASPESNLARDQRLLVKEKRYLVYLKTLKVSSELRARGVPFHSFESFSRSDDIGGHLDWRKVSNRHQ